MKTLAEELKELDGMTTIVEGTNIGSLSPTAAKIARAYGLSKIKRGWPGKDIQRGTLYLMAASVKIDREQIQRQCGFNVRLVGEAIAREMVKVMEE